MEYGDLLERGVTQIIERSSLERKLGLGKPLIIKHGVDPTTTDLHLGHAVIYRRLRRFQELGHTIVFLIGDFTGRFGDPTERLKTRPLRSKKEVMACAKKYLGQVAKILDPQKTQIRFNGEWYDKMTAEKLLHLQSNFSFSQIIERDMFQERLRQKQDIRFHELTYPILQGFDSVMLRADLTVIGQDQLFNELQGRRLQTIHHQAPQDILAMKVLPGTDGKAKMSQSLGNEIGLDELPQSMFGKIMSIPDSAILAYFELCTDVDLETIKKDFTGGVNPGAIKSRLALEIVSAYHGASQAQKAEQDFNQVYREKKIPSEIPEIKLKKQHIQVIDLLVENGLASSKSAGRRLIEQGGVQIDGESITQPSAKIGLHDGMVIKVGKHKFLKIHLS